MLDFIGIFSHGAHGGTEVLMAKIILWILIIFISIPVFADNTYDINESILLSRGYIKFDPHDYYTTRLFRDSYTEIFQADWFQARIGYRHLRLNIEDEFIYSLFYVLERDELPNILTIVYLQNNGKVNGFYKKNFNLERILMETIYGDLIVFY